MQDEVKTFEDLEAWKKCRDVRKFASWVAKGLASEERFRLADQMLRSSRSTTANIAEGYGRFHYQENLQFCRQARGSLCETLDHFITGNDDTLVHDEQLREVREIYVSAIKVLNGYIGYLERCAKEAKRRK